MSLDPSHDPSNDKRRLSLEIGFEICSSFFKKGKSNVHEHFQRFSEELQNDEEFLQELTMKK